MIKPDDPQKDGSGRRTLAFRAVLSEMDQARGFLRDCLRGVAVEEEDFYKLELALVEICVNIIRYAYPDGPGMITVAVALDPGVCLEIRDAGRAFDPRRVPVPDLEEHVKLGRRSGLGVFLARSLVDEFEYRREGGENVVTLTQCLPALPCD